MTKVFTQNQIMQLKEQLKSNEEKYTVKLNLNDLLVFASVAAFGTRTNLKPLFEEARINDSVIFGSHERVKFLINNLAFSARPTGEIYDQLVSVVTKAEEELQKVVPDTVTVYHAILRHNEHGGFNTTGVHSSLEALNSAVEKHYPSYSIFQVIETEAPAQV